MNRLYQDVRFALRQLRRAPSFTLTAVLTLALGIGASSAIFCLMDAHWLHPMRVPHPGELVRIFATTPQNPSGLFTYSEYQALAQRTSALKSVVALGRRGSLMPRSDGTSALLLTNVVSSNFFDALGVKPILGRSFTSADASTLRTHPGVLLGYDFWRREFGGDPNIVGRQITLLRGEHDRNKVDIWGVLPSEFREIDNDIDRDLWMPAEAWAAVAKPGDLTSSEFRWFNVLGRRAPGSSVAQVHDQVATTAKAWALADPASNKGRGARAVSDFRYRMANAGTSGLVLFAIVGSVVLLAAVNVAHLLLARALGRGPEIALRMALGARRATLARQLLIENLLLCLLSLSAGLAIASGIAVVLPRLLVREPAMLVQVGSAGGRFPGGLARFPVRVRGDDGHHVAPGIRSAPPGVSARLVASGTGRRCNAYRGPGACGPPGGYLAADCHLVRLACLDGHTRCAVFSTRALSPSASRVTRYSWPGPRTLMPKCAIRSSPV